MIATAGSQTPACWLLVVAGNVDTQAVLLEHAKAKGHSVISASTPALGLSTFDMMQPDIVITDLFFPEQEGRVGEADLRAQPDLPRRGPDRRRPSRIDVETHARRRSGLSAAADRCRGIRRGPAAGDSWAARFRG